VLVTVGQPSIWSLEQAHYLLARIRERNLGLRNKSLDESDLDPNSINATRIDAERSLLNFGVSFDQGLGLTNKLNRQNLEFEQNRRQELFAQRSGLFSEKSRLLAHRGRVTAELNNLEDTKANEDLIAEKKREINATNAQIDATTAQIDNLTAELTAVGTGSSALSSPSPTAGPGALPAKTDEIAKKIFDDFEADAAKNPHLTASTKLDNYIQMQYELLAKQLTLLRDEVGPRERLIFLELPTSIYANPGGDEMSAISRWKVSGYYVQNKFANVREGLTLQSQHLERNLSQSQNRSIQDQLKLQRTHDVQLRGINEQLARTEADYNDERAEALRLGLYWPFQNVDDKCQYYSNQETGRVLDLIPRQSSLNVSDIKEITKEHGFKFLFSLLIGIGGSVDYQNRKDHFEQFQQQEVYASGFGKGTNTFGWIFNPAPGTKRLVPGIRTTYAVLVIPRNATKIRLSADGNEFNTKGGLENDSWNVDIPGSQATTVCPPSSPAPDSSPSTTTSTSSTSANNGAHATANNTSASPTNSTLSVTLDVPDGPNSEGFFVNRIDYPKVNVDTASVVVLTGTFSNQTGVLVNGIPLAHTVGLANPLLDSEKGTNPSSLGVADSTVKGYYEVINRNQLIMSFLMPSGFRGTPKIALISPTRARSLNDLILNINGTPYSRLDDEFRVGAKPDDPAMSISDVQISPQYSSNTTAGFFPTDVNLTLTGQQSSTSLSFLFNATQCSRTSSSCKLTRLGDRFYHLTVELRFNLEKISFTVIQGKDVSTRQLDNPLFVQAVESSREYEVGEPENATDDFAAITFEGRRINDLHATSETATDLKWKSRSNSQGVLLVGRLSAGLNVVQLTDSVTNTAVTSIVIRRLPPASPKPPKEK